MTILTELHDLHHIFGCSISLPLQRDEVLLNYFSEEVKILFQTRSASTCTCKKSLDINLAMETKLVLPKFSDLFAQET